MMSTICQEYLSIQDTSPWIGADGEMLQRVKDHYANAIIASFLRIHILL